MDPSPLTSPSRISRHDLGVSPQETVFISGANLFKIIPALRLTWARILEEIPNSPLVLYPRIEAVLRELKSRMTIILVTNLVQQARRLADRTAFFLNGRLVEVDRTEVIFSQSPSERTTFEYENGLFG